MLAIIHEEYALIAVISRFIHKPASGNPFKLQRADLWINYFVIYLWRPTSPKRSNRSLKSVQFLGGCYRTTGIVNFNDEMALTIIPEYAASTFATAPFYIQQLGTAWVHVKENNSGNYYPFFMSNRGHYHLSYENFVPYITQAGQFGKPAIRGCATINPVKEPRVLNTHDGNQWIKIYAYDYNSPSRVFDLLGIKVTKGPIQLWYRKDNGDWLQWPSLGVGTWNLSAYSTAIKEVLISSTGNTGSIGFDNVKILMPAN